MKVVRFDPFELDLDSYQLRRKGHAIHLEKIPLDLLILLIEKNGDVVLREEIISRIWGQGVFIEAEQAVNTAISKIRQALRDDAEHARYVQTVVGRGYRFVGSVREPSINEAAREVGASDSAARVASMPASQERQASYEAEPHPVWRWWLAGIVAATLVLMFFAVSFNSIRKRAFASPAASTPSLAVLPFENLSRDPAEEYFADGMTDELITDLGQMADLRVISRTSAMHYKGAHKTLPEIARELRVDMIVEGTVEHAGNHVRVRVQLIRANDDQHLWADRYDRDVRDVLALQKAVAGDIANQVHVRATPQEQARMARSRATEPDTYNDYLRGRYFWNKRTEASLRKGIEYFQSAVAKDPSYAPAYAGLADCYSILAVYTFIPPQEGFLPAKMAAVKALELDEQLSEAHVSRGIVYDRLDWDHEASEREMRRAIELSPNNATAHHWHSYTLNLLGRSEEAEEEMKRAMELDPFSLPIEVSMGTMALYKRKPDEAIAHFRKTLELDSNFVLAHSELGRAYEQAGMYSEAIEEFQQAARISGSLPRFLAEVAHGRTLAGQKLEARRMLQQLRENSKKRYVSPYDLAYVYVALGENGEAFDYLDKSVAERSAWLPFIALDSRFDALHSDDRFEKLRQRIGVAR